MVKVQTYVIRQLGSSASIVNRLQGGLLENWGLIPSREQIYLSSTQCPDRLWGKPSLLYDEHQGLFPHE
jgi:hypothetical protein